MLPITTYVSNPTTATRRQQRGNQRTIQYGEWSRGESSQGSQRQGQRQISNNNQSTTPSTSTTVFMGSDPNTSTDGSDNSSGAVIADIEDDKIYSGAITRTLFWVAAACVFGFGVWEILGPDAGEQFFAGYLIEQSLSIDNLFVFLLLFDYFKVPISCQDRVLNWGIGGAIVMRATMIGLGSVALHEFRGVLLVFAGILVFSGVKVLLGSDDDEDEEEMETNGIVTFSRNLIDSVDYFDGDRFFTEVEEGVKKATPLLICMIAVEISDVIFAVDSIPAVFGVTENPFIVFTSNMFAIMGLRSLYTILSKAAKDLEYLEQAVAIVLCFIGCKMIAEYFGLIIPTPYALAFVASLLAMGVGFSLKSKNDRENAEVIDA